MGEADAQQRELERELYVQQLEATVDALQAERAQLLEDVRAAHLRLRSSTGLEGALRDVKARARTGLSSLRGASRAPAGPPPAIPLSSLPTVPGTPLLLWKLAVDVGGDVRSAVIAEPPFRASWDVELPARSAARGAVTLRPGAWPANRGGVDLQVQAEPLDGAGESTTLVTAVDPAAREQDRRWVPWRLEVPTAGRYRVTLSVTPAAGASADYAWGVIAEPAIEVPGLAPRATPAVPPPSAAPGPPIAILLPVHDPDPGLLDRTIASVLAQTTEAWELCVVDDGSTDVRVRDRLAQAARDDRRVRVHRHDAALGISGATNAALALATAPFVATLDHDDLLAPDAIAVVAAELATHPETDVLYTDNDLVAADRLRFAASLKPDWSPDLLRACMYTLHLGVYRRSLVEQIGGWRSAFDGAQDHDLVLRLTERSDRVRHVPRVLAHWRAHAGSAALGELAKPQAYERGRAAVAEHLERTGHTGATVEALPQAGRFRVRHPRTWPVAVHLRVPTSTGVDELEAAVAGLLGALRSTDLLVLQLPAAASPELAAAVRAVAQGSGDSRLRDAPPPDVAGDRVDLHLDGVLTPADADAIDELAGHVEAGAVAAGGLVTDGLGHVVAGGIAFPRGLPVALHTGEDADAADRHPSLTMVSNRLAVSGAVAVKAAPLLVPGEGRLALVALSLRAGADGGRVVWTPHARFVASPTSSAALTTWPLAESLALDRGATPDPFWNPQRWADSGIEMVPGAVHENPLLDVVDA